MSAYEYYGTPPSPTWLLTGRAPGVRGRVVIGLGGIGSAAAYWLAGASAQTSSGSSGSSSATSAARRRITRGSSGSATTRPATCGSPRDAYDAWSAVEEESGERLVDAHRRARPVPGRGAHGLDRPTTRARLDEVGGIAYELARRGRDDAPVAAVAARRRRPGHVPGGRGDRRGGEGERRASPARRVDGRHARRARAGDRDSRERRAVRARERRGHVPRGAAHPGRGRLDERAARAAVASDQPHGDAGAGDLLRVARPRRVRPRAVPGLDLDGRRPPSTGSRRSASPAPRSAGTWAGPR